MENAEKFNYLIVEDEFSISKIISDMLNIHPQTEMVYNAKNGAEGLEVYKEQKIDIVITDILMPIMSGIDLIKQVKVINPDAQILVESAFSDIDLVREAMRMGAYDYILKPFTIDDMMIAINRLIERLKFIEEKKNYVAMLERKIKETTTQLQNGFLDTLSSFVYALEVRDSYVHSHSQNVSKYSTIIAKEMRLNPSNVDDINIAGILHDIGKIGIPDAILQKPAKLSNEEYDKIKEHPTIGKNIVYASMHSKPDIVDMILYHHERFDGRGYPMKLSGTNIPLVGRIACVADSFDSMVSDRVYKNKKSIDESIEDMKSNKGTQFDPEIAQAFINYILAHPEEFK